MNEKGQEKKFLSVKELSEWLGVSKSLIYERVYRQEIPCLKLGSRILIPIGFAKELIGSY